MASNKVMTMADKLEIWRNLKNNKSVVGDNTLKTTPPKCAKVRIEASTESKLKNRQRYRQSSSNILPSNVKLNNDVTTRKQRSQTTDDFSENNDPNNQSDLTVCTNTLKEFQQAWNKRKIKIDSIRSVKPNLMQSTTEQISNINLAIDKPSTESDDNINKIKELQLENESLKLKLQQSEEIQNELILRTKYAIEEYQAQIFHNDILQQKISEMNS